MQQHVLKQREAAVPNVANWNKLWKEDIKALRRKASYAELTKDLWKHSAPSASMAYYLPSQADGSLQAFYERPQGESSSENLAHINGITPGADTEYYNSDFTRGQAPRFHDVHKEHFATPGTTEQEGLRPQATGLQVAGGRGVTSLRAFEGRKRTQGAHRASRGRKHQLQLLAGAVAAGAAAAAAGGGRMAEADEAFAEGDADLGEQIRNHVMDVRKLRDRFEGVKKYFADLRPDEVR